MNIHSENCHCCEQKTRRKRDNKPTCGHCIAVLDSKHEEIRKCPVDSKNMKKEIFQNIILGRCPKCSGIWFDSDELESFEQLIRQISNELMVHKIVRGIFKGEYEIN